MVFGQTQAFILSTHGYLVYVIRAEEILSIGSAAIVEFPHLLMADGAGEPWRGAVLCRTGRTRLRIHARHGRARHGGELGGRHRNDQRHGSDRCKLDGVNLLDRFALVDVTGAAGAKLGLAGPDPVVDPAADANPERRFEKQEQDAGQAAEDRDRPGLIEADHPDGHDEGDDQAQRPCKALLRRAGVFRHLAAHHEAANHEAWRETRIDEHADREIQTEGKDGETCQKEVAFQERIEERDHAEEQQDAGTGACFALVQHPHLIVRVDFAETNHETPLIMISDHVGTPMGQ